MAQVQQRRALQAIVQELLSESCREKVQARCSPSEFLPQEQPQKPEQQHPSSLPPHKTRRSCSRSLPRSGFSRLPRPPGCGLMLHPFFLRDGPAILMKHLLSRRPAAAAAAAAPPPPSRPPGPANLVKRLHARHSVVAAAMLLLLRCSCCCCCSTTSDFPPVPPFPPPRWPMNPGKASSLKAFCSRCCCSSSSFSLWPSKPD